MKRDEQLVVVDEQGGFVTLSPQTIGSGEIVAAQLLLLYLEAEQKLVLFRTADSPFWFLPEGKIISGDLLLPPAVGKALPPVAYKRGVVRMCRNQLRIEPSLSELQRVEFFLGPAKKYYFTLFVKVLGYRDFLKIDPNPQFISRLGLFSVEQLKKDIPLAGVTGKLKSFILHYLKELRGW